MATINKNTDPKALNKLFGDGDFAEFFNFDSKTHVIQFFPPSDEKFPESYHWHHMPKKEVRSYVECMGKQTCPICEALKPTKWQRIKSWKLWHRFWLKMGILIASMVLILQTWNAVMLWLSF